MFHKLRNNNSSALVVAIVALVASLGGTAVAAKLITGKQIANSSITGQDIKNKSLTKKDFKGSVRGKAGPAGPAGPAGAQGPAGTPDGYTKTEADAAFLGKAAKAADANLLDNVDSDDYVAGDAGLDFGNLDRGANTAAAEIVDLGTMGRVLVTCGGGGTKVIQVENTSGAVLEYTASQSAEAVVNDVDGGTVAIGATENVGSSAANMQVTLQVVRPAASLVSRSDFSTVVVSATDDGTDCEFRAHTINSERDGASGDISG